MQVMKNYYCLVHLMHTLKRTKNGCTLMIHSCFHSKEENREKMSRKPVNFPGAGEAPPSCVADAAIFSVSGGSLVL